MATTLEALSVLLGRGHEIRERLRADYFCLRQRPDFDVSAFLQPFLSEIAGWKQGVQRALDQGFESPTASVTFKLAPVSPWHEANTSVAWGNVIADLEAKLRALLGIVRDADPRALSPLVNPNAVFLVHGRSDDWNLAVEAFLADRGISAILLEDQPNLGRTLIEKFEANADVGAAIILFTADDLGCLKTDYQTKGLVARARQNVLIELGFFFARLGRRQVCLLKEPEVEVPSDLSGIVYTQIELSAESEWAGELSRELIALGITGGGAQGRQD